MYMCSMVMLTTNLLAQYFKEKRQKSNVNVNTKPDNM